ncbi:hypothetical protein C450_15398 [Halococcus salifodinae DSM 8989]|uniref:Uncharacterized protein n=1 Tax=Halococcus salifodinae DSM 8989 TaxID=1227456 RepID=M0MWK2_9EURY|nr:hypothetical protein C450_15398 [Halococcus salifodinae DSM 8989]
MLTEFELGTLPNDAVVGVGDGQFHHVPTQRQHRYTVVVSREHRTIWTCITNARSGPVRTGSVRAGPARTDSVCAGSALVAADRVAGWGQRSRTRRTMGLHAGMPEDG